MAGLAPPVLSPGERDAIGIFCGRSGRLLRHYSDRGQPVVADADPLILRAVRRREPRRAEALAAYDFAERLPTGCCSLDLEGRVRFLNAAAADLLGAGAADLMGSLPWERLLWVDGPAFEDAYRAAVISKQSTSFTALRPPDQWLSFRLVPGASGVSVTVTPAAGEPEQAADGPAASPGARGPVGASAMYQLMYLAATLTEAVGVQDVVDQVADQLIPAFEAQGLVVLTAEGGRLRVVGHRGYSDEFMAKVDGTPLTSSIVTARALSRGTPLFFTSFADLHHAYPQALRFRNRDAWAFLPLITSGRPVGLLVLSYDRPRPFPQAERNVLIALAGLIAQALDRAHLYDTKHQLARTLQAGLLPKELPRIPGLEVAARYLPASTTGARSAATSTTSSTAVPGARPSPSATCRATICRPPPSWGRCASPCTPTPPPIPHPATCWPGPTDCSPIWTPACSPAACSPTSTWSGTSPAWPPPGTPAPDPAARRERGDTRPDAGTAAGHRT